MSTRRIYSARQSPTNTPRSTPSADVAIIRHDPPVHIALVDPFIVDPLVKVTTPPSTSKQASLGATSAKCPVNVLLGAATHYK